MNARRRGVDEVVVIGLGLCTPLGLTARSTLVEMAGEPCVSSKRTSWIPQANRFEPRC